MKRYSFELWQDRIYVASAEGADLDSARAAIMHYALVYLNDGPVTIQATNKHSKAALATVFAPG